MEEETSSLKCAAANAHKITGHAQYQIHDSILKNDHIPADHLGYKI